MNEESIFFVEQIYLKYGKSKSHYKFIDMKINQETIDSFDKKERLMFTHIFSLLNKKTSSYLQSQKVELPYDDDAIKKVTSSKNEFYSLRNKFEELGLLIKYKKYIYFVNPNFINNMSSQQWDDLRNNKNDLWLLGQGIIPTNLSIE